MDFMYQIFKLWLSFALNLLNSKLLDKDMYKS